MKHTLINLARIALAAFVLGALFYFAWQNEDFRTNVGQLGEVLPTEWPRLLLGWLIILVGISITITRWFLLVRALGLPFQFGEALQLGFIGYLFNFALFGTVGGDLVKAGLIARRNPGRRAEAVATVVVDRIVGLYGLLVVATIAIIASGLLTTSGPAALRAIVRTTLIATGVGGAGILMLLVPGFTSGALSELLTGLPKVGPTIGRLIGAIRMYRRQFPLLLLCLVMSGGVHTCSTLGAYMLATALPGAAPPSLVQHFVIIPLAMVAGAVPVMPAGLGQLEGALMYLYSAIAGAQSAQGLLVAVAYRVATILNAGFGALLVLRRRQEVAEAIDEAEHGFDPDDDPRDSRNDEGDSGVAA